MKTTRAALLLGVLAATSGQAAEPAAAKPDVVAVGIGRLHVPAGRPDPGRVPPVEGLDPAMLQFGDPPDLPPPEEVQRPLLGADQPLANLDRFIETTHDSPSLMTAR